MVVLLICVVGVIIGWMAWFDHKRSGLYNYCGLVLMLMCSIVIAGNLILMLTEQK